MVSDGWGHFFSALRSKAKVSLLLLGMSDSFFTQHQAYLVVQQVIGKAASLFSGFAQRKIVPCGWIPSARSSVPLQVYKSFLAFESIPFLERHVPWEILDVSVTMWQQDMLWRWPVHSDAVTCSLHFSMRSKLLYHAWDVTFLWMSKSLSSFRGAHVVLCLFETNALDPKEETK